MSMMPSKAVFDEVRKLLLSVNVAEVAREMKSKSIWSDHAKKFIEWLKR